MAMNPKRSTRILPWIFLLAYVAVTISIVSSTQDQSDEPNAVEVVATVPLPTNTTQAPAVSDGLQPSTLESVYEPVAEIAEAVSPAVVQISTTGGLGSGVIYDQDGLILTAAHVVQGATDVAIRLYDGSRVDGVVIGTHPRTDVAVIKIDGRPDLPVAELAVGTEIRVGQLAVALGSPFGLEQTVTSGIVSAVDRNIDGISMVQTDAAINPGNSGGPLVDSVGRVIGINDQIFTNSGGNEGIGFAISIDLAVIVANQLVEGVEVRTSLLGVSTSPSPTENPGVVVTEVVDASAASTAGIQVGDVIVSFDGESVADIRALQVKVINTPPGTSVTIDLVRNGRAITVEAVLGQN